MQAWTDGDARAYGACFTPDADYVSYDGTHAAGRAPMVANHDRLFRGVVAGSALVGEVESIRYLRPDVAIVHANGSVLMPWRRKLPRRQFSRQTLVAVRTPQGWRFEALHNTRVRPQALPAHPPQGLGQTAAAIPARLRARADRPAPVAAGQGGRRSGGRTTG